MKTICMWMEKNGVMVHDIQGRDHHHFLDEIVVLFPHFTNIWNQ